MLIIPDGYDKWNKFHESITPGRLTGRTLPSERGYPVEIGRNADRQVADKLRYVLPNTFCPDCDRTEIVPTKGQAQNIHLCKDADPHLDLKPGDVLVYFVCEPCIHAELWGKQNLHIPGGAFRRVGLHNSRQERREKTAFAFLRALNPDDRERINVASHAYVR